MLTNLTDAHAHPGKLYRRVAALLPVRVSYTQVGAWLIGPGWRLVWALVSLGAVLPLVAAEFLPLYDYYHWLFTGHLVTRLLFGGVGSSGVATAYALIPAPVPNLAAPVGIGLLEGLFPRELAGGLFLAGCVLVLVYGFAYLVRAVQGQRTLAEWLGWPWAFGYFLSAGYVSYMLALGLLCLALGLLHRSTAGATQVPPRRILGLLMLLGSVLYLAHLAAWGVWIGALGVYALLLVRRRMGRAAIALAVTTGPALVMLGWYLATPHGPTPVALYAAPVEKALALIAPFQLFLRPDPFPALLPVFWANLGGYLLLAGLWWASLGRPRLVAGTQPLLIISVLLVLSALVMPFDVVSDLIRPEERLLLPALFCALAACRYRPFRLRSGFMMVGGIVLLVSLHLLEFRQVDQAMQTIDRATSAAIPPRAAVLSLTVYEWEGAGACQRDPVGWSVGAPTLRWFGLDRLAETRQQRVNLMTTSLVVPRFDAAVTGADLLVLQMTPAEIKAAPLGAQYGPQYPYVEIFGCPADIQGAQQAFTPQYKQVLAGSYFVVLKHQ